MDFQEAVMEHIRMNTLINMLEIADIIQVDGSPYLSSWDLRDDEKCGESEKEMLIDDDF